MTDRETRLRSRIDLLSDRNEVLEGMFLRQKERADKYRELAYHRGKSAAMWRERYFAERRSKIKVAS